MTDRSIPEAAYEAACLALLGYTGGCACGESYTGRNLTDPDCLYHSVPAEAARDVLEAAAPHMLAKAWDEGRAAGWDDCLVDWQASVEQVTPNPYRTAK